MRGRRRPSRSGFRSASAYFSSTALTACPPNWLRSAAFTFAANDSSCREAKRAKSAIVIAGAGTRLVDRVEDRPAALAGVLHVAADLLQARVLLSASTSRSSSQLRTTEPCCQSAATLCRFGLNSERLHDLEPLGERLHHPVLDPVVDHLHEVAGAGRADVRVAAGLGQVLEERLDLLVRGRVAADHHAVALLQAPDRRRRRRRRGTRRPSSSPPRRGAASRGSSSCRRRRSCRRPRAAGGASGTRSRSGRPPGSSARRRAAAGAVDASSTSEFAVRSGFVRA